MEWKHFELFPSLNLILYFKSLKSETMEKREMYNSNLNLNKISGFSLYYL